MLSTYSNIVWTCFWVSVFSLLFVLAISLGELILSGFLEDFLGAGKQAIAAVLLQIYQQVGTEVHFSVQFVDRLSSPTYVNCFVGASARASFTTHWSRHASSIQLRTRAPGIAAACRQRRVAAPASARPSRQRSWRKSSRRCGSWKNCSKSFWPSKVDNDRTQENSVCV